MSGWLLGLSVTLIWLIAVGLYIYLRGPDPWGRHKYHDDER